MFGVFFSAIILFFWVFKQKDLFLIFIILALFFFLGAERWFLNPGDLKPFTPPKIIQTVKNQLLAVSEKTLPGPYSQVLNSLILGETAAPVPENIKNDFLSSGLIHLLVASGTQIAILIGAIAWILNQLGLGKIFNFTSVIFFSSFISIITGFGPSILRAAFMAQLGSLGNLLNRQSDGLNLLSGASLILLFINPLVLFDIGFQLSFAASFSLVYLLPCLEKKNKKFSAVIFNLFLLAALPTITTAPIIAYYFNRLNLAAILANFLVLPWIEILIVLGALTLLVGVIFLPLGVLLSPLNLLGLVILLKTTQFFSQIPGANLFVITPSLVSIWAYYAGLIFFCFYQKNPVKKYFRTATFISLILLIVFFRPLNFSSHQAIFTFFDVGQADAIFIKTPANKKILIDSGGYPETPGQILPFHKYSRTLKYLAQKGINQLDLVIITHPDSDHLGGLPAILETIKTNLIIDSGLSSNSSLFKKYLQIVSEKNIKKISGHFGQTIAIEPDFKIYFLYPVKEAGAPEMKNQSLVAKIVFKKFSAILTGDIEKEAEEEILKKSVILSSTVLKVAHHGSHSSTSEEFLKKVQPQVAIISVGQKNKFGHPHQTVLDRLKKFGVKILRTDQNGTIEIKTDGQKMGITLSNRGGFLRPSISGKHPGGVSRDK